MDLSLADHTIVVTGAAQGLGRALALGLAAEGARVGVLTRARDRSQVVVDEIAALDAEAAPALALQADVSDEDQLADAAAEAKDAWGRLDGLIVNAGWMPGRHRVLEMERSVLDRVLGSNLVGSVLTTKHFAPLMVESGGGRIIYMSSIAAVQAAAGGSAYSMSKAGLNMLNAIVHQELADDGVRTIAIAPGLTVTPGMEAIMTPEHRSRVEAAYPGGRIGRPEDIVGLAVFLCSEEAQHISGTVITVRPPVTF